MLEAKEQKVLDEINDAIKAIREKSDLLDKANTAQETKQAEQKALIEKACRKIDEIEIAYKRAVAFASGKAEKTPEFKAFLDWMRKATPIPADIETKVMRISDPVYGGYLASADVSNELLKQVVEWSPIREIARVRPTSKESAKIRRRTGSFAAQWTGETQTKAETAGLAYGWEQVPNHELYALVDITNWDLEDSDFDLEAELNAEFGEQFGVAEGTAFISGNAVAKPEGILTNPSIGYKPSGDTSLLKPDGLFALYFAPKTAYIKSAKWVMNRATMLAASVLKDSALNYLLRRLGDSPVWTILGADVVEAKDMPDIASNAYPILFGDFQRGYLILDRIALAILRDPFSAATSNAVRFHARKRVGGQVIMPEAIWKQKIATS